MADIEIAITDEESAECWANRLAQEAGDDQLFPDEYLYEEAKEVADVLAVKHVGRRNDLFVDTPLSEKTSMVVSLKEAGLTNDAIEFAINVGGNGLEIESDEIGKSLREARRVLTTMKRSKDT